MGIITKTIIECLDKAYFAQDKEEFELIIKTIGQYIDDLRKIVRVYEKQNSKPKPSRC